MANLLVYVAPTHLDELLGTGSREPGRRIQLERAKLPPQIERLDARSTLFFITTERARARIVASLENPRPSGAILGEAVIHDHDITNLIERLGCAKVWQVPRWAATPSIVPPEDAELLRYHLGLPLEVDVSDDGPNAPIPVVHGKPLDVSTKREPEHAKKIVELETKLAQLTRWIEAHQRRTARVQRPTPPAKLPQGTLTGHLPRKRRDTAPGVAPAPAPVARAKPQLATLADALRVSVFASPASNTARREYAAHLEELGDARGELIALQLARVERGEPISDRERELVARVGDQCAEPLRPYLETYELRRGFVWKAVMARGATVPPHVRDDPAWATIEDLATTDADLLLGAQLSSLQRARIDRGTFGRLAGSNIFIDTLLPYPKPATHPSRGIGVDPAVLDRSSLRTHSLCIDADEIANEVSSVMESKIVRQLSHLDAWIDAVTAGRWRAAFDKLELPLLTLRFAAHGIEPLVGFERRGGAHRMIVELRATVSAEIARDLAALIASLATGIDQLELVDTSLAPFPAQQPDLVRALDPSFKSIELRRGETMSLV